MRFITIIAAFSLFFFAACGDDDEPSPVTVDYENDGPVCLGQTYTDTYTEVGLEADEPFRVTVPIDNCLSSSCTADQAADCQIEVDDDVITVTASASYTDLTEVEGGTCTEDCGGAFYADCGEITLGEGTYTIHHGDETSELTIPSDETVCH